MTETGTGVRGGRVPWAEAVREYLRDAQCLWQDLDGVSLSAAPPAAPHTSLVHAWTATELVRVRVDRDVDGVWAHVAAIPRPQDEGASQVVRPWQPHDGRVAGFHRRQQTRSSSERTPVPESLRSVVADGIDEGVGPITFVYVP